MAAPTRREFIKQSAASLAIAGGPNDGIARDTDGSPDAPWYRRTYRWAQTNISEFDPTQYDIGWWRRQWKRTCTQGVIINAGGIVAFYPTKIPLHRRAEFLGDLDLFGELSKAARNDGLVVIARMDSSSAGEEFYRAHPDWFAVDASGRPYRSRDLYVACTSGPYFEEYIPTILREIAERYHPEGFADNNWVGATRSTICYCANCRLRFRVNSGHDVPPVKNWSDPIYRKWIEWSYARRLEIWDLNNRTTKAAGGSHCIWCGMLHGSIADQCSGFRLSTKLCERSEIVFMDHQARSNEEGFQNCAETARLFHGLLGWDKLIPNSTAMYQAGRPTFRVTSKPEPEVRIWTAELFAGGFMPWWHHINAYHEDRRAYRTAEPLWRWHKANNEFLVNRQPIANVGIVWSQENTDFYGRDNPDVLVDLPWRGIRNALVRSRIPYLPVCADHIERDSSNLSVLILPNLAVMSDAQVAAVRRFVRRGGGLIATGESSLYDRHGDARKDFALADIFGAHILSGNKPAVDAIMLRHASDTVHSYLRCIPELRARVDGPQTGKEPKAVGERHPALRGFDATDILPFGGVLEDLRVDSGAKVLLTFIPPYPVYPPEFSWMRVPRTSVPGLIVNAKPNGARIAFLPADIDRRYGRDNLPDHANLLANLVRWAGKDLFPLEVKGAGMIDCQLYRQHSRLILHLVNLTSAGTWRAPIDELIRIGPIQIRVRIPADMSPKKVRLLVSDRAADMRVRGGWAQFDLGSLVDHEVAVIS